MKLRVSAGAIVLFAALGVWLLAGEARRPRRTVEPVPTEERAVVADEPKDREDDRAAIRKAAESFLKAFESGDPKAVSAHWTPEGEYISDDGTSMRGRAAIEKAYAAFFKKNPKPQAELEMQSLRFPSRDTAVEEGFFKVRLGKSEAKTASRYSILHVREGGKWLMAVVREWPSDGVSLRDIEWLIGNWTNARDGVEVQTSYEWDLDRSFIRGRFTIKGKERTVTGFQVIGRDPATGDLRSWTFDNQGGFGHAVWTRDGNTWTLDAGGVDGDGSILSATNILKRIDDDTFTWQLTERTEDGEEQPNLPPIKVTRVKGKQ